MKVFVKQVLSLPLHICVLRWWFSSLESICQAGIISTAAFRDGGFLAVKVFAKLVLSPPPHICIAHTAVDTALPIYKTAQKVNPSEGILMAWYWVVHLR